MSEEEIHAVVVAGLDMPGFLRFLPPLEKVGSEHGPLWSDCEESQIAIAVVDEFILATGRFFRMVGESVAREASRESKAVYLYDDIWEGDVCIARFNKGRPAGRVEVSSFDVVADTMRALPSDWPESEEKLHDIINSHQALMAFMGKECPTLLDWIHYKVPGFDGGDDT